MQASPPRPPPHDHGGVDRVDEPNWGVAAKCPAPRAGERGASKGGCAVPGEQQRGPPQAQAAEQGTAGPAPWVRPRQVSCLAVPCLSWYLGSVASKWRNTDFRLTAGAAPADRPVSTAARRQGWVAARGTCAHRRASSQGGTTQAASGRLGFTCKEAHDEVPAYQTRGGIFEPNEQTDASNWMQVHGN